MNHNGKFAGGRMTYGVYGIFLHGFEYVVNFLPLFLQMFFMFKHKKTQLSLYWKKKYTNLIRFITMK